MSEIAKTLGVVSCCALLLTLALRSGPACIGQPFTSGTPTPEPGAGTPEPGAVETARIVQFFNCNHDNPGTPGRVYNVYAQVDNSGTWLPQKKLKPVPDPWTDCHDAAHLTASLTVDMFASQPGKWEFRLVKPPLPGELACDSSNPDLPPPTGCSQLSPYFFQTVQEAAPVMKDVTSP